MYIYIHIQIQIHIYIHIHIDIGMCSLTTEGVACTSPSLGHTNGRL